MPTIVGTGSGWEAVLPTIGCKKLLKPIVSAIAHKKMAHQSPFSLISFTKKKWRQKIFTKYAAAAHLDNFVLLIPPAETVRGKGDPLQWTYYLLL